MWLWPFMMNYTHNIKNVNLFTKVPAVTPWLRGKSDAWHTRKVTLSHGQSAMVKPCPALLCNYNCIILVMCYNYDIHTYIYTTKQNALFTTNSLNFAGQNHTLLKNSCERTLLPVLPLPTELASTLFTVRQSRRIWLASWEVQGQGGTHTGGRRTDGERDLHRCIELLPFYLTGQRREEIWFCCDNWSAGFRPALYIFCLLL